MMEQKDIKYSFGGNQSNFDAPLDVSLQFQKHIPASDFCRDGNFDSFNRQDSLAMCSELQGNDDLDIFNNICDLRPYMAELGEEEFFAEDMKEPLQPMMDKQAALKDKQTALLNDINMHYGSSSAASPNYAILTNYNSGDMSESPEERYSFTPEDSYAYTPNSCLQSVKEENIWEDQQDMDVLTPGPSKIADKIENVEKPQEGYEPKIKPRKYNLKSEVEKKNNKYLQARARNNDAVRKSRQKKKNMELAKEREMDKMRAINCDLKQKCESLEQKCSALKEENRVLKQKLDETVGKLCRTEQKSSRYYVYRSK